MFYFWRGATAALVPGFLCQSGRRRPENVSILSSLLAAEYGNMVKRQKWADFHKRVNILAIFHLNLKKQISNNFWTAHFLDLEHKISTNQHNFET